MWQLEKKSWPSRHLTWSYVSCTVKNLCKSISCSIWCDVWCKWLNWMVRLCRHTIGALLPWHVPWHLSCWRQWKTKHPCMPRLFCCTARPMLVMASGPWPCRTCNCWHWNTLVTSRDVHGCLSLNWKWYDSKRQIRSLPRPCVGGYRQQQWWQQRKLEAKKISIKKQRWWVARKTVVIQGADKMCTQRRTQMITYKHREVYGALRCMRRQQTLKHHGKLSSHVPALHYSHRKIGRKKIV